MVGCFHVGLFAVSDKMRRSSPDLPLASAPQPCIHLLERPKKSRKGVLQRLGTRPCLPEVAVPELIRGRNRGRAHGTVFVSPLRPSHSVFAIDPQPESHACSIL